MIVENKAEALRTIKEKITNWTEKYAAEPGMESSIINSVIPKDSCKIGNNYINPKAHKPAQNYPSRMISTGCAAPTKAIAALTAVELSKVKLQYIIEDLDHFLMKIKNVNEEGSLLGQEIIHVSLDIVNMFPSISKSVGLEQCRNHLEKRENPLFSTECIIEALDITLENNLTEFDGKVYRQCKGTAMGPKNACIYADVAMNYIDVLVNENGPGSCPIEFKPILWLRFRDDVYIPWVLGLERLKEFVEWLNTLIPGIKFTMKISSEGTAYLETFVYDINGHIHTKSYSKPCDDHTYLTPTSCHAAHSIRNIPYNIALRLYKISSEPAEYIKSKNEYTKYLLARGYSTEVISEAFHRVEQKPRECYIRTKDESSNSLANRAEENVFPLTCEFNPSLPCVGQIIGKHKHILSLDDELTKVIKPDNIFASYRGSRTIQDLLIHSKLPDIDSNSTAESNNVQLGGCQPCTKGCHLCKHYLKATKVAYSYHTSSTYPIQEILDCNTMNVVYVINDKVCQVSYTGCTADCGCGRFPNHKCHIKMGRKSCELSTHFIDNPLLHPLDKSSCASFDTSLKSQLEIIIVEKVKIEGENLTARERLKQCEVRELFWQERLRTLQEYGGLNVRKLRS